MKELTKAEEQVMQYLWKLEKGFLKDIVDEFPEPKPAYTTVSTVIRVLVKKGFIGFKTYGKIHEYFPKTAKTEYFGTHFKGLVNSFFNGSNTKFASHFTNGKELNLSELEEIKQMVEQKINELKSKENHE
ncbi:MAG TPA: penicillinase repressor [Marinilabiliales bacterium]|jgi:predicted transcriptional regulator|nr:BlaI/MecI/CopY family transcriptional regulator [Salinivirgaceae bacterium]OFX43689.1 MAG: penicillinase repressor [Bacteroidetes bacterium GWA2_40_14]OFX63334.1 MAG: penicillinase repressor [Bacteroidetes bacterium GWC2_40_13]OFX74643.1 MAG: penicillinase repressor [Bacteroidetes bacterium GWD2_40_43]OFX93719.1 MAG: penicillinase repressor [Bacteroidetes bacterium GWE2_40_63]OFY18536.1 MAG: penicillinase repressor [Bacteroidetes bacterium GWF2_40_13]OFZ32087.1 MAG: penicillinase repressor